MISEIGSLDRVIRQVAFLVGGNLTCDLEHRRQVASLCILFKILDRQNHGMSALMPGVFVPGRSTRLAANMHKRN